MNEHKVKALTIRLLLPIADEVSSADAHKIMIQLEEYALECKRYSPSESTADPK